MPSENEPQRSPLAVYPSDMDPGAARAPGSMAKKGTLAAVIGSLAAALALTMTPEEESGRKVKVDMAADGTATVEHVRGKQYLRAYLDIARIPTACDGLTRLPDGTPVKIGMTFTEAQCATMLEQALVQHAKGMMACSPGLRRDGMAYQRAGALLFTYNVGVGGFCGSTARKRFDAGDMAGACAALLPWDKARVNGVLRPVKGLTMRRNREREVCRTGTPGFPPETLAKRLERWL